LTDVAALLKELFVEVALTCVLAQQSRPEDVVVLVESGGALVTELLASLGQV